MIARKETKTSNGSTMYNQRKMQPYNEKWSQNRTKKVAVIKYKLGYAMSNDKCKDQNVSQKSNADLKKKFLPLLFHLYHSLALLEKFERSDWQMRINCNYQMPINYQMGTSQQMPKCQNWKM